ncbi:N-acetylmuramoyl-L-alanine amidase AmiD precursor [compost metagenome]
MFPWQALYLKGVGAWFDEATRDQYLSQYTTSGVPGRSELLGLFKSYGYDVSGASSEGGFQQLVRAFQMHFRPEKFDGKMDAQTAANLKALVFKYFSG